MKLWLDEARPAPDATWTICRTVSEAELLVRRQAVGFADPAITACSLDHDLSTAAVFEIGASGLTFVRWMIRNDAVPPEVEVHSQNVIGGGRMVYALWTAGYRVRWAPYHWPVSWTFG